MGKILSKAANTDDPRTHRQEDRDMIVSRRGLVGLGAAAVAYVAARTPLGLAARVATAQRLEMVAYVGGRPAGRAPAVLGEEGVYADFGPPIRAEGDDRIEVALACDGVEFCKTEVVRPWPVRRTDVTEMHDATMYFD